MLAVKVTSFLESYFSAKASERQVDEHKFWSTERKFFFIFILLPHDAIPRKEREGNGRSKLRRMVLNLREEGEGKRIRPFHFQSVRTQTL